MTTNNPIVVDARRLRDVVSQSPGDWVRIEVAEGWLAVFASDGVVTVETRLKVESTKDDAATLPRDLLAKTLRSLDGDVALTLQPNGVVFTTASGRRSVAATGRLPLCPRVPDGAWSVLSSSAAKELASALRYVIPAALQDPSRPTVSGCRVDVDAVVACDGARLHSVEQSSPFAAALTLPLNGADAVADLLESTAEQPAKGKSKKAVAAQPVQCAIGERVVAFRVYSDEAERLLLVRREPEPFCDWRRLVVDDGAAVKLRVDTATLLNAVKGCVADSVELHWCADVAGKLTLSWTVRDAAGVRRIGDGTLDVGVTVEGCQGVRDVSVRVSVSAAVAALGGCGETVTLSLSPASPLRLTSERRSAVIMYLAR